MAEGDQCELELAVVLRLKIEVFTALIYYRSYFGAIQTKEVKVHVFQFFRFELVAKGLSLAAMQYYFNSFVRVL